MRETQSDLDRLQSLLDDSIARAGPFLRESFQMPDHCLSAKQIAVRLQGINNLAFATTTKDGQPRVAPIGSIFYRGAFYPSVATAARTRMITRNAAVSLSVFEGNDFAIVSHGQAAVLRPGEEEYEALAAMHREINGQDVMSWGEGVYLRFDPAVMYTFARYPDKFPAEAGSG